MGDYTSETHRCLATYSKVPKDYNDCLTLATNNLEACALEELIIDTDALHKYDVDNTAYMSLKQVLAAQEEMEHLVNAADHTYVKQSKMPFGEPKAATFKKYKETFMAEKKSIDLEVEITKRRIKIDKLAEKISSSDDCKRGNGAEYNKLKKEVDKLHDELVDATKQFDDAKSRVDVLKGDVKELKDKLDDLDKDLKDAMNTIAKLKKAVNTEVGSMKKEENLLLRLIKQRRKQPKTRLRRGWKISCWVSRNSKGRIGNYDRFNFERVKPDGQFVTKPR